MIRDHQTAACEKGLPPGLDTATTSLACPYCRYATAGRGARDWTDRANGYRNTAPIPSALQG